LSGRGENPGQYREGRHRHGDADEHHEGQLAARAAYFPASGMASNMPPTSGIRTDPTASPSVARLLPRSMEPSISWPMMNTNVASPTFASAASSGLTLAGISGPVGRPRRRWGAR
jgi:hypothetical protein